MRAERNDADVGQAEKVDTFASYIPRNPQVAILGREHPDPVVESSALASVAAPKIDFSISKLCVPRPIIDDKLLSNLQLESILYANYRHSIFLNGNVRSGFLLGDGAGIGKGRQIAGLIYDNFIRGRTKALWFSASTDLKNDAGRDFKDIGAMGIPIANLIETDARKPLHGVFPKGVVFSTYSALISGTKNAVSRLEQLIEWCSTMGAGQYDGVIVFDECHKAKAVHMTDVAKSSKTAQAVIAIQQRLPRARVVYVSATGASELSHLAYMDRLGLWGAGTAFESAGAFKNAIEKRGVGAMELVAMDMKARGLFLARTLSYQNAEFGITTCDMSEEDIALYDTCTAMWMRIRVMFDDEIEQGGSKMQLNGAYWGAHQRFYKEFCMATKIDDLVAVAKDAVEEREMCVVIGLQSTGEASMVRQLDQNRLQAGFLSTCEDQLRIMISKLQEFMHKRPGVNAIKTLTAELDAMALPPNALDSIIDRLGGTRCVAEMTGRTHRIVRDSKGGMAVEKRTSTSSSSTDGATDSMNTSERKAFQSGEKLYAILKF